MPNVSGDLLINEREGLAMNFIVLLFAVAAVNSGCSIISSISSMGIALSEDPPVAFEYLTVQQLTEVSQTLSFSPTSSEPLYQYQVSPLLPSGLILDPVTGVISGTTTTAYASAVYTVTATTQKRQVVTTTVTFEIANRFNVNLTTDHPDLIPGDGFCETSIGLCTLRAAIEEANQQTEGLKSIIYLADGVYRIDDSPITVSTDLILRGSDRSLVILDGDVDGTPLTPLLDVDAQSGYFELDGITLQNAGRTNAPAGTYLGIALKSLAENIVLKNCQISNNSISSANLAVASGGGVYHLSTGNFEMDNCLIENNTIGFPNASGYSRGGGAYIQANLVKIQSSKINNNQASLTTSGASYGGGLMIISPDSEIIESEVSFNRARNAGGGIDYSNGPNHVAKILKSTLSNNEGHTFIFGTTIAIRRHNLNIEDSTILQANPGGSRSVWLNEGNINILNSTLLTTSGNPLIEITDLTTVRIEASTLKSNNDTISFFLGEGKYYLKSSILMTDFANCLNPKGEIESLGYNIVSDDFCFNGNPLDLYLTNPLLNGIAINGGLTQTMTTQIASPARSFVPAAHCQAVDQRGIARPVGMSCDAGSTQGN